LFLNIVLTAVAHNEYFDSKEISMKAIHVVLFAILALSLAGCAALAAAPISRGNTLLIPAGEPAQLTGERTIRVNGEASMMVEPDEVVLTVGIETRHAQLKTAKQRSDQILRKANEAAKASGIEARYIQTDYIQVEMRYKDYESSIFDTYVVRQNMVLTLRDIDRFEDLLAVLLDAGITNVHGIQFRTTELRKYRDQARALALKAAQEKAIAMAGELGQDVGEPLSIEEGYGGWFSWYDSWWGSRVSGMTQNVVQNAGPTTYEGDSALAPGQIAVTANVTVSFGLK
jgi:uncharacterized protein